jgi:hypothetical protein
MRGGSPGIGFGRAAQRRCAARQAPRPAFFDARARTCAVVPAGSSSGSSLVWRRVKLKVLFGILPRTCCLGRRGASLRGGGVRPGVGGGGGGGGVGGGGGGRGVSRPLGRARCWRACGAGARGGGLRRAGAGQAGAELAGRRGAAEKPPRTHLVQVEVHRGRRAGGGLLVDEADAPAAVDRADYLAAAGGGRRGGGADGAGSERGRLGGGGLASWGAWGCGGSRARRAARAAAACPGNFLTKNGPPPLAGACMGAAKGAARTQGDGRARACGVQGGFTAPGAPRGRVGSANCSLIGALSAEASAKIGFISAARPGGGVCGAGAGSAGKKRQCETSAVRQSSGGPSRVGFVCVSVSCPLSAQARIS